MTVARCPKCKVEVGATWRWCLACGYDPDGSAQRVRQAAIEARQRESGWLPVVIVLAGLLIGGAILWRTTPDESSLPTVDASTAAEVTSWVPFAPPGAGFRVDLPSEPSAPLAQPPSSDGTATANSATTYAVSAAGHLFVVQVTETAVAAGAGAPAGSAARDALEAEADRVASSHSGRRTESAMIAVGDAPALDFTIEDAAIGTVRGRVVLVGSKLGTVYVASAGISDELADHAIDSLAIE